MAELKISELAPLVEELTIVLEPNDYIPTVKDKLKEIRSKASMKGFRKGKTPMSMIRKLYGKQAYAEAVYDTLNAEIGKALTETEKSYLGQPLPLSNDFESQLQSLQNPPTYNFSFEIGVAPEIELKGLNKKTTIEQYEIVVPDETISEEIERMQKQLGTQSMTDEQIIDNDLLTVNVKRDADNDPQVEAEFKILPSTVTETMKKKLVKLKKGSTLKVKDLYEIEDGRTVEVVNKHWLGLEENTDIKIEGPWTMEITEVSRLTPAELDEDFFKKVFPDGDVTDEVTLREKVAESAKTYYSSVNDSRFYKQLRDKMLEKNDFDLPAEFLKKWLKSSNEEMTDEKVEEGFEDFISDLKWTLLRGKIAKAHELEVTEKEIIESVSNSVRGYFGGQPVDPAMINGTVQRLLQDERTIQRETDEIMARKIVAALQDVVKVKSEEITTTDLEEKLKAEHEEQAAATAEAQA